MKLSKLDLISLRFLAMEFYSVIYEPVSIRPKIIAVVVTLFSVPLGFCERIAVFFQFYHDSL